MARRRVHRAGAFVGAHHQPQRPRAASGRRVEIASDFREEQEHLIRAVADCGARGAGAGLVPRIEAPHVEAIDVVPFAIELRENFMADVGAHLGVRQTRLNH